MKQKILSVIVIMALIFANYVIITNLLGIDREVGAVDQAGLPDVTFPEAKVVDQEVTLVAKGQAGNNCYLPNSGTYVDEKTAPANAMVYVDGFLGHVKPEWSFYADMPYGKDPRGKFELASKYREIGNFQPTVGMEFGTEIGGNRVGVCKVTAVTDMHVKFLCTTYKD